LKKLTVKNETKHKNLTWQIKLNTPSVSITIPASSKQKEARLKREQDEKISQREENKTVTLHYRGDEMIPTGGERTNQFKGRGKKMKT